MFGYDIHKNAGTVPHYRWHVEKGILVSILDIDNHITEPYSPILDNIVISGLKKQRLNRFYLGVGVATNNKDKDHVYKIVSALQKELEIEVYAPMLEVPVLLKPKADQGFKIAAHFEVEPEQTGVSGDRRISDIGFGRNLGAGAMALCMRIGRGDSMGVKIGRIAEQPLIWFDKLSGRAKDFTEPAESL